MEIDKPIATPLNVLPTTAVARPDTGKSFEDALSADQVAARNLAARNKALDNQKPGAPDNNTNDIAFIRENGMRAYVEEAHERRQAELRAKILEAMGLNEAMLQAMPPEQRQTIEDMIAQEIQERMASDTVINGNTNPDGHGGSAMADNLTSPQNLLAAQVISGDSGMLTGKVISEATQGSQHTMDEQDDRNAG